MGKSKQSTSSTQSSSQSVTPQATAEETAYNKMILDRESFLDPQIRQTQSQGLDLVSRLLGGQALPGYLNTLPGGISPEVTQGIVDQSLRDLNTQLAFSGAGTFLESGASQAIGGRAAADIRNQSEQFNLQNLMQLLNLGVGGQAQVQAPILGYSGQLSQRLAGLRSQTGTSSSTGSTIGRSNPFMDSFSQSLGNRLGSPTFGLGPFTFGG